MRRYDVGKRTNFRRGLVRLFVVFSFVWCVASGGLLIYVLHMYPYSSPPLPKYPVPITHRTVAEMSEEELCTIIAKDPSKVLDSSCFESASQTRERHLHDIEKIVAVVFLPPVVIYALLFEVGGWVYQGFKRTGSEYPTGSSTDLRKVAGKLRSARRRS